MRAAVKKIKNHHSEGCLICSTALEYIAAQHLVCDVCGNEFDAESRCKNGHFVCDACHARGAASIIEAVCRSSTSTDAWAIALELMHSPAVAMHGPEHHVLAGAALLAAYCNATGERDKLAARLAVMLRRGAQLPGGTCGHWGACGAALSAGVFLAAVTEATPLSRRGTWATNPSADAWALGNTLTARCLAAVAQSGGPRCCKRSVGLVIREAVAFLREELDVSLALSAQTCEFSARNRECHGAQCAFFASTKAVISV